MSQDTPSGDAAAPAMPPRSRPLTVSCPTCDAPNPIAADAALKSAHCSTCGQALFTGHPITLTAARFNAHTLQDGLPLLIDFWADWCGPCKSMAPVFERLAAEFEPHVRFAKLDTDAEGDLANYFRIQTIPTLSFIHNRREVARISGAMFAGDLRRWIYSALSDAQEDAEAGAQK